jgi:hypothetical protein
MRRTALPFAIMLAAASSQARAQDPVGRYRLANGPDVASELVIRPDGHFQYFLIAGALDEHAEGHWVRSGRDIELFTDPKPVPAVFSADPSATREEAKLSLLVAWPNGRGIAGIDFRIGFASGDPVTGYTQDYGWSMPPDETRSPLWIELAEPIHGIVSPRFQIDLAKGHALHFTLTPNDIEVFDFRGTRAEVSPGQLIMHRDGGTLRYVRSKD